MFGVRIVGAGAIFAASIALTVTSVMAQTPSAPLPLLQFVHHDKASQSHAQPKAGASAARKTAARRHTAKRKLAKAHRTIVEARRRTRSAPVKTAAIATPIAAAPAPKNNWPTPDETTQNAAAPAIAPRADNRTLAAPTPTNSVATAPVIDTDPNEIMGNNHAVEVALPTPADPANAPQGAVKTAQVAGSGSAPTTSSSPAAKPVSTATVTPIPVVRAMIARPVTVHGLALNRFVTTSWIAHVLAALGGAIAAGVLAWFLIGPAPERTYG